MLFKNVYRDIHDIDITFVKRTFVSTRECLWVLLRICKWKCLKQYGSCMPLPGLHLLFSLQYVRILYSQIYSQRWLRLWYQPHASLYPPLQHHLYMVGKLNPSSTLVHNPPSTPPKIYVHTAHAASRYWAPSQMWVELFNQCYIKENHHAG